MLITRKINFILLFLILVFVCNYSHHKLQQISQQTALDKSTRGLWDLPSGILLVVAGEFKGLFSDYLTLEVGSRLGTKIVREGEHFKEVTRNYNWSSIYRLFLAIQKLDPAFLQPAIVMQGWMPWSPANMVEETQDYLQFHAKYRYWDWQPYRTMAFNAYYFEKNIPLAGQYFLKASRVENSPSFLGIVGSRLAQKGGDTDTAILIVKSMLIGRSEDEPSYEDLTNRLVALQGVKQLENGIIQYKQKYNELPNDINKLITNGLMQELPHNPYGVDYCMSDSGQVFFDSLGCK